tara:strand:- start:242 stop:694 length:453 start_codon:yes stop_codon:yes gene_type:complete
MQNEITELRNQVRTLKRIVYGFGCLLVAGVVIGATSLQTVPDVIQAKKFEVVNDEGIAVVTLESFEDSGVIHTTDSLGYINFLVMSEKDSNGITCGRVEVQNANTKALVVLSSYEGQGVVVTGNYKGEPTSITPAPTPTLTPTPNPKTSE